MLHEFQPCSVTGPQLVSMCTPLVHNTGNAKLPQYPLPTKPAVVGNWALSGQAIGIPKMGSFFIFHLKQEILKGDKPTSIRMMDGSSPLNSHNRMALKTVSKVSICTRNGRSKSGFLRTGKEVWVVLRL